MTFSSLHFESLFLTIFLFSSKKENKDKQKTNMSIAASREPERAVLKLSFLFHMWKRVSENFISQGNIVHIFIL